MLSFFKRIFASDPFSLFNDAVADFAKMERRLMLAVDHAENEAAFHKAKVAFHNDAVAAHEAVVTKAHEVAAHIRDFIETRL